MKHFLICSLPRSRTAWLANFFTWQKIYCAHEATAFSRDVSTMLKFLSQDEFRYAGNSDSAQVLWIEKILHCLGDSIPIVIIERKPEDVITSMRNCGLGDYAERSVELALPKIEWLKKEFDPLVITFESLNFKASMSILWEYCVPDIPFPQRRWNELHDKQVQVHASKLWVAADEKFHNIAQWTTKP